MMKTKELPGNKVYDAFSIYDHLLSEHYGVHPGIETRVFKKGAYIYTPIQKIGHMYELVEGAVKIGSHSDDGEEVVYDVFAKG